MAQFVEAEGCGLFPDGVIGIFHLPNPSDLTVTLGWRRIYEMNTSDVSCGVKTAGS